MRCILGALAILFGMAVASQAQTTPQDRISYLDLGSLLDPWITTCRMPGELDIFLEDVKATWKDGKAALPLNNAGSLAPFLTKIEEFGDQGDRQLKLYFKNTHWRGIPVLYMVSGEGYVSYKRLVYVVFAERAWPMESRAFDANVLSSGSIYRSASGDEWSLIRMILENHAGIGCKQLWSIDAKKVSSGGKENRIPSIRSASDRELMSNPGVESSSVTVTKKPLDADTLEALTGARPISSLPQVSQTTPAPVLMAESKPTRIEIYNETQAPVAERASLIWKAYIDSTRASLGYGIPDSTEIAFVLSCSENVGKVEFYTHAGSKILRKDQTVQVNLSAGSSKKAFPGKAYFNEEDNRIETLVTAALSDVAPLFQAGDRLKIKIKGDEVSYPMDGAAAAFTQFAAGCTAIWSKVSSRAPLIRPMVKWDAEDGAIQFVALNSAEQRCGFVRPSKFDVREQFIIHELNPDDYTSGGQHMPLIMMAFSEFDKLFSHAKNEKEACAIVFKFLKEKWPEVIL